MDSSDGRVGRRYSIARARDRLSAVVREAEGGMPAVLTRRGRPVAVVLSVGAYRQLAERPADDFWSAYERFRASTDLAQLRIPSRVFGGVRDRSPGRGPAF